MPLAAPPAAPNRSQPTTFSQRADDFLSWLASAFGGLNGIGYPEGAGGTVTQLTSRTTGVTLNKPCGRITMFSAAGSATVAEFTFTNSLIEATDLVMLHQSGGTNVYRFSTRVISNGSCVVTFQTTGGTAVDAPTINFAIIKAVTA